MENEFKTMTFKEISDAFNSGKHVEVEDCDANPFKLVDGRIVDKDVNPYSLSDHIYYAMIGNYKARIIEPKVTRYIVVFATYGVQNTRICNTEKEKTDVETFYKAAGCWLRTVKVEV